MKILLALCVLAVMVFVVAVVVAQQVFEEPIKSDVLTIHVTPGKLKAIYLIPGDNVDIGVGEEFQVTARCEFRDGSVFDCPDQVRWTSFQGAIVDIDETGLATGIGIGTAFVQAEEKIGSIILPPTPAPTPVQ